MKTTIYTKHSPFAIILLLLLAVPAIAEDRCTEMTAMPDGRQVPAEAVHDTVLFRPHWFITPQVGVAWTVGEASFGQLLSPAVALSAGYQIHPVVAVQAGLSGFMARNWQLAPQASYRWYYIQPEVDVLLSFPNMFGYRPERRWDLYLLAGIGANIAFHNDDAITLADTPEGPHGDIPNTEFAYLWTGTQCFAAGRFGLGFSYQVHPIVSVLAEANVTILGDRWNSKHGLNDNIDWQNHLLLGVRVALTDTKRTEPTVDEALAQQITDDCEAQRLEAERQARERAEAERLAREKAIADSIAEAERLAREKTLAESLAEAEQRNARDTLILKFRFDTDVLQPWWYPRINEFIQLLQQQPQLRVELSGFCSPEGDPVYNQELANRRVRHVRNYLIKHGIEPGRIKVVVSDTHSERIVICSYFIQ